MMPLYPYYKLVPIVATLLINLQCTSCKNIVTRPTERYLRGDHDSFVVNSPSQQPSNSVAGLFNDIQSSLLSSLPPTSTNTTATINDDDDGDENSIIKNNNNNKYKIQNNKQLDERRKAANITMFHPLTCNNALMNDDDNERINCHSTTLSSLITTTKPLHPVLIPCGTCVMIDTTDGSTLDLPHGLIIEGKLYSPPTASLVLKTIFVIVVGVWKIDIPHEGNRVTVHLYGENIVHYTPVQENKDACHGGDCEIGSKVIAVMGGKLDIVGYNPGCPSWEKLQSITTSHDTTNPQDLPPSCHPPSQTTNNNIIPHDHDAISTGRWYGWNTTINTIIITTTPHPSNNNRTSFALKANPRPDHSDNRGLARTLPTSCLTINSTWRLSFKVKLIDGVTHESIDSCIPSHLTSLNCPKVLLRLYHDEKGEDEEMATSHVVFDQKMIWKGGEDAGWSTFNTTLSLTPNLYHGSNSSSLLTKIILIITGGPNDSILLVDDVSLTPASPIDTLVVSPLAATCWSRTNGTELVLTSHTRRSEDRQLVTMKSINDATGAITLHEPLKQTTTTLDDHEDYAVEVAYLNRAVVFEAASSSSEEEDDDNDDDGIGGHLMILRTANVTQRLEGVEMRNFGQRGRLGRYPVHFHLCEDLTGSVVRNNVVRESNQRGYVAHGTDGILWENNVAFDIVGHCYFLEDGSEMNNVYKNNLGLDVKNIKPEFNLSPLSGRNETDIEASVFWISNPYNHFIGNIAAGSEFYGWWYELHKRIRGPSSYLHPNTLSPQHLPLGRFVNNTSHSIRTMAFSVYPPAFQSPSLSTFKNLKIYRNNYCGLFVHLARHLSFDGLLVADNGRFAIRLNQADNFTIKNSVIRGVSPNENRPSFCDKYRGLTAMILGPTKFRSFETTGRITGVTLDNVVFEYWSESATECGKATILKIDDGEVFIPEWDAIHRLKNVTLRDDAKKVAVVDACDALVKRGLHHVSLEDPYGYLHLDHHRYDRPGFVVSSNMKAFFNDTTSSSCSSIEGGCLEYCPNVCLRMVKFLTSPASDTIGMIMMIEDENGNGMNVTRRYDERGPAGSQLISHSAVYAVSLPVGRYTIRFVDDKRLTLTYPKYVIPIFEAPPMHCTDYITENDVTITQPNPERSSCDNLITNGNFFESDDISSWIDIGSGITWREREGRRKSGALATVNRTNPTADYIGYYIDTSCLTEHSEWVVTVSYRLIDNNETNENVETCREGGGDYCPMASFVHYFRNETSGLLNEMWMDKIMTDRPYKKGEKWNVITGFVTVDKRRSLSSKVLFTIGVGIGQFLISNVSIRKYHTSTPSLTPTSTPTISSAPTLHPCLKINTHFSSHDSLHNWHAWGNEIKLVSPGYNDDDDDDGYALMSYQRDKWLRGAYPSNFALSCLKQGQTTTLRISSKVKMYDEASGAGIPCHPTVVDEYYNCPLVRIQTISSNDVASYQIVRDTSMIWNPDGWNTFDTYVTITNDDKNNITSFRPIFAGGPAGSVLVIDNVMFEPVEDMPSTAPTTYNYQCVRNMIVNGNEMTYGEYWDSWGVGKIIAEEEETTSLVNVTRSSRRDLVAIKAFDRQSHIHGMYQRVSPGCFTSGSTWHLTYKTQLRKAAMSDDNNMTTMSSGESRPTATTHHHAAVRDDGCDPKAPNFHLCPFVILQSVKDGADRTHILRDSDMIWNSTVGGWSTFNVVFTVDAKLSWNDDDDAANEDDEGSGDNSNKADEFRIIFVGGEADHDLVVSDVWFMNVEYEDEIIGGLIDMKEPDAVTSRAPSVAPTELLPTSSHTSIKSSTDACDRIVLYDGIQSDKYVNKWASSRGTRLTRYYYGQVKNRPRALVLLDRNRRQKGVSCKLPRSCLDDATKGTVYAISFQIKMRMQKDKADITSCTDPTNVENRDCPFVQFRMIANNNDDDDTVIEIHSLEKHWNMSGWNTFKALITVTEEMVTRENVKNARFVILGGPKGAVLILDNVILTKMDALH